MLAIAFQIGITNCIVWSMGILPKDQTSGGGRWGEAQQEEWPNVRNHLGVGIGGQHPPQCQPNPLLHCGQDDTHFRLCHPLLHLTSILTPCKCYPLKVRFSKTNICAIKVNLALVMSAAKLFLNEISNVKIFLKILKVFEKK